MDLGKFIGYFDTDGELLVTDPCYEIGTWCSGKIKVKKGKYAVFITKRNVSDWGERIIRLFIVHEETNITKLLNNGFKNTGIDVGVDSGQAGFFNLDTYKKNDFYERCCKLTSSDIDAGVREFGAVSNTGFGDGSYECFVNNGDEIFASYIEFISEEEIDEWENEIKKKEDDKIKEIMKTIKEMKDKDG